MSFPRYPAYKDSGVEWLGEVPGHWKIRRLKFLCDIQTGSRDTENAVEDGEYPFFVRSQTVERINSWAFDCEAVLTAGDGAGVGKVFHHHRGPFDFHQRVYMLNNFREASGLFLFHFLRENFYKVALEGGAKSTVDSLRRPMFTNFPVSVPPADEQRALIAFVEAERARIDALTAEQQRLIELLAEKRQAVISLAVTRGLDPNAAMTDSGIDWIGPVPAHWRCVRNKAVFHEVDERSETDSGELLTVSHITGVTRRSEKDVNMILAETLEGYKMCRQGDLVINTMWAWMGALGCSPLDGLVSPSYNVYRPRVGSELLPAYYDYLCRLPAHRTAMKARSSGVWESRLRLYPDAFLDMRLVVPPIDEQRAIVARLAVETAEWNALIAEAESAIDLLQERRTALITAAVTGQIDVRDIQPQDHHAGA
jgi:type I restriction enzyme S subunit